MVVGCANPAENLPEPTATPVGTPIGAAFSAVIGASGGSVKTTDGRLSVRIPAGALSTDTNISIQPITNTSHGARGVAYELLPDGQVFAEPAEITLAYDEADLEGTAPEFFTWAVQNAAGLWEVQNSTLDSSARTLMVSTSHFSRWSPGIDVEIFPSFARVKTGYKKQFVVQMCSFYALGRDAKGRSRSRFACTPASTTFAARALSAWMVNDVPGGNSTIGTVYGPELVDYTAPSQVPSPDRVTLSAVVTAYDGTRSAPIEVGVKIVPEGLAYGGRYTFTQQYDSDMTITGDADLVWTQSLNEGDVIQYKATAGQIRAHFVLADCDPVDSVLPVDDSNMLVYPPSNSGLSSSYYFYVSTQPMVSLRCGTPRRSLNRVVGVVLTGGLCHAPMAASYDDEKLLRGSEMCPPASTSQWSFSVIDP